MVAGTSACAAVAVHADALPQLQLADHGFGHEEADFEVLGRKHLHDGISGRNPFALAIERVEDQAIARRSDLFLLQLPRCLLPARRGRRPLVRLGFDLLIACGKAATTRSL